MAAKTVAPRRKKRKHAVIRKAKKHPKGQHDTEPTKRRLSWPQVEVLTAMLNLGIYQSNVTYDVILVISRGGLVPGCLLSQGFANRNVLPVAIERYPGDARESHRKPHILYFPEKRALKGKKVLIVDDVWDFGHSFIAVERELMKCGPALVHTAALEFKPTRNKYPGRRPTFYAEETADWVEFPWESFPDRVLSKMVAHFATRRPAA
jgi:uncharacterized protein